ncbi:MAG: hypothetical protein ACR2QO_15750 [Acidimicrobiales bacterium]
MRLPRRLGPENEFDTGREANLLGHDDGSALAAYFVDLRSRMAEVPEVAPSAEVLAYLRTEPLGDVPDTTPPALASPSVNDGASLHDRPCEVSERRSPWLAAAAIALIAGGGAVWWSIGLGAAGSSSSSVSVSAGLAPTVFEHDTDETARATVDLGSAGAVTVDRTGRQPLLTDPQPGDGWHLTDQREDGTQLTLASNDREILTVTIVIDDPVLWLEVSSTRSTEVARLLLADDDELADDDDDDGPPSAAAENAPADSIVPEPAGAQSGVPATGVAPGGGAPSSGISTTQPEESVTSPPTVPTTTDTSAPAPAPAPGLPPGPGPAPVPPPVGTTTSVSESASTTSSTSSTTSSTRSAAASTSATTADPGDDENNRDDNEDDG